MSPLRLHVVALPHTQVARGFECCAYTTKVRRFCRMMSERGHAIFLYGGEENEAPCAEHVVCISEEERCAAVGARHYVEAPFDSSLPHWVAFNTRAAVAIAARAQPRDFLCLIAGVAQRPIADALPRLTAVEFGVGYGGVFAKFRVFESYAWMHTVYGSSARNPHDLDGRWFDAVIPNYFEVEDFPAGAGDGGYLLYLGRMIDRKGVGVAVQVCRELGLLLVTAGPGERPGYGSHVGVVDPQQRAQLLCGARALLAPTLYLEPFGGVAVEAQLCGTPVIATDWGGFTETVEQGVTGFRCRTLAEFKTAALAAPRLDRGYIRRRAIANYSLEAVAPQYEHYFARLLQLWGNGWYEEPELAVIPSAS